MASPSTAGRIFQILCVLLFLFGVSAIALQCKILILTNRLLEEVDPLPTVIDYLGLSVVNGALVAVLGVLSLLAVRRPTRFLTDVSLGYAILTLTTSVAVSVSTVFQLRIVADVITSTDTCTPECGHWFELEVALSAVDIAAFLLSAVHIFLLSLRLRYQLYLPVECVDRLAQMAATDKIIEDSHLINSPTWELTAEHRFYCNECMKEVTATRFRFA